MVEYVMVNGLPGKMATAVAEALMEATDFELLPYGFTGPGMPADIKVLDKDIHLVKPEDRLHFLQQNEGIPKFLTVDYTHPTAVLANAGFYCRNNLPFVMGTTGGDMATLEGVVGRSQISAVIAPNMAKQIVVFQSMMKYAADTFPNAFKGYILEITESHQKGKADTSGTAKDILASFNALGIPFKKEQIYMIRDPQTQLDMGVPKEALSGHGWHTYTLRSEKGDVLFQFKHNVNGRSVYADGTLDALRSLKTKKEKGKIYTMMDVLKGE